MSSKRASVETQCRFWEWYTLGAGLSVQPGRLHHCILYPVGRAYQGLIPSVSMGMWRCQEVQWTCKCQGLGQRGYTMPLWLQKNCKNHPSVDSMLVPCYKKACWSSTRIKPDSSTAGDQPGPRGHHTNFRPPSFLHIMLCLFSYHILRYHLGKKPLRREGKQKTEN